VSLVEQYNSTIMRLRIKINYTHPAAHTMHDTRTKQKVMDPGKKSKERQYNNESSISIGGSYILMA